jgi:hypothetical protein
MSSSLRRRRLDDMETPITTTTWPGTPQDRLDLLRAVKNNCECRFGLMGTRLTCCPAHLMLVTDRRALDGMLFARRIAAKLQDEEWAVAA